MKASPRVWCVQANDGEWCATFRGHKPSEDATSDRTACGMFVIMRYDGAKRYPTCTECRKRIARRRIAK